MRTIAMVLGLAVAAWPAVGWSDEPDDLRALVDTQAQLIQELRSELHDVREEQQRSEDRLRALEDTRAAAAGPETVDRDYVDRRIEAFEDAPLSRFLVSGYGASTYRDEQGSPSTFDLQFSPSFHFRLTDKLHFNSELELEFEEEDGASVLEIGLEYAHIDYLATDWLTVSAGKVLIPFNQFGPRLHPQWINKFPSAPPIYGGHDGGGIIPVLSDAGVVASGGTTLWRDESKWNYALYVTNGPRLEPDEDEHGEEEDEHAEELRDLSFDNIPDDNNGKAVGGRIGFLPIPNLEIGASFQSGTPRGDDGRFTLWGLDAWYWWKGLELRGEYIRLSRDVRGSSPNRWGYYLQAAYRLRQLVAETPSLPSFVAKLEPVLRWGEVNGAGDRDRDQLAIGLNYWLYESVPLKLGYEFNGGDLDSDRFFIQLAYGF